MKDRTCIARVAATAIAAMGLVLLAALPAAAHDYVVSSSPAEGEILTATPEFFVITASETLLDLSGDSAGFAIQITDEAGLYYGDGCTTVRGASMSMPGTLGTAGKYTLAYQYVSADGHTVSDTFAFSYEPTASGAPQSGTESAPTCNGLAPSEPGAAASDGSSTALGIVVSIMTSLALLGAIAVMVVRRGRRDRLTATSDTVGTAE